MAAIIGRITGVRTKRVKQIETDKRTKQKVVVGTFPVLCIALESDSCDVHAMEQAYGEMIGKGVKVAISLEQGELGV